MLRDISGWHILYTKPEREKNVMKLLRQKKIEAYQPLYQICAQNHRSKKQPLFPSYVFTRMCDEDIIEIRKVKGVLNFVYWGDKPVIIPDEEVNMIKKILTYGTNVQIEKTGVHMTDHLKIMGDSFAEQQGNGIAFTSRTLKVLLPTLGYMLIGDVENLEGIEPRLSIKIVENGSLKIRV